jgi:hypothetical protein
VIFSSDETRALERHGERAHGRLGEILATTTNEFQEAVLIYARVHLRAQEIRRLTRDGVFDERDECIVSLTSEIDRLHERLRALTLTDGYSREISSSRR